MLATKPSHPRVLLLAACLACGPVGAWQAPAGTPVVSPADLARAAGTSARLPSLPPAIATPRAGALPQPNAKVPLDLGAIAKGYAARGQAIPPVVEPPALLVFVSFSMPEASLMRLTEQAAKTGAVLVLRGLDGGSLRATAARVQKLIGKRQVGFQVDPQAFDRYNVRVVPSFVLTAGGPAGTSCPGGLCESSRAFVSTSGDVSIDYALEHIERRAPAFAAQARRLAKKLEG